jgi:hypothetical protein
VVGGKPYYAPGPKFASWSKLTSSEQTKLLLHTWISRAEWPDIAAVNFRYSYDYNYTLQPVLGREKLLIYLRRCQPNQWYSCESLLRIIWENEPLGMHAHSPYASKIQHQQLALQLKDYAKWRACDGEIYIGMLTHTLRELGLIDIGYASAKDIERQKDSSIVAFQLTELGDTVLNKQFDKPEIQQNEQHKTLIVQPNFELLLIQPDFPTLYQLLPFAQVEQIGLVSRLTLTKAALLHGIENGLTLDQIVDTLTQRSQKDLPQNVIYTLNDWSKSYQEVKISQVYLLEVSDEDAGTRLLNLSQLKKQNIRKLTATTFIISSEMNLQTLQRLLDKEGIHPHFGESLKPDYSDFVYD